MAADKGGLGPGETTTLVSGLIVRAATAWGRRAGSVARLAFSLSLGW